MVVVPFIIFPAIVPALLAGALLLRMRWLRLHHFLAAGGASAWLYLKLTKQIPDRPAP